MGENPDRGDAPAERAVGLLAGKDPDEALDAALEASTRTEASLSALMRAVKHLTTGVTGAQEANERLAVELENVRQMLASANEQRLAFKNRIVTLEETLRRNEQARFAERATAEQDRNFLVDEQDRFLAALLEEHDEQLERLKAEIAALRKAAEPSEKPTLPGIPLPANHADYAAQSAGIELIRRERDKLLSERDRSRELLRRIQEQRDEAQKQLDDLKRERDEAQSEVSRLSALLDAPPELCAELSAQNARRMHPTPRPLTGRRTDPQAGPNASDPVADEGMRATTPSPPSQLQAALAASRMSRPELPLVQPQSPAAGTRDMATRPPPAALLRKQDPSQRPLGSYSVQPEEGDRGLAPRPAGAKPPER
jgi:predicted  nucleic acid-binding Zn-ribbon protein